MPVSPVVAYAAGMTPAATVSGATPDKTKNSTAGTPSRSRASARDTLLVLLPAICVLDMSWCSSDQKWIGSGKRSNRVGDTVGEQGPVHGGLGVGDQFPQAGIKVPRRFLHAADGV